MKIVIIAEKPSVAREIASIVGATNKEDGYIEGNNYLVTWAFGHLIQLAMPKQYGAVGFNRANLPILPKNFELIPRQVKADKGYKADSGALKQLKIIEKLFNQCDKIIVATDAGREGELIFRYIYNYLGCTKPFERLWISSLTEKAIRQGLDNLKVGNDYDNLFYAAQTRSEADWLVGINATQALSIAAGRGIYSLGRVQTPTLAMICSRYLENKEFKSKTYFEVQIKPFKDSKSFIAVANERFDDKESAERILSVIKTSQAKVMSVERKEIQQLPPLLYDLTSLQKDMNRIFDFSADKTLSIAQKLYESKLITYPRTGSRYIPEDMLQGIYPLLTTLWGHPIFGYQAVAVSNSGLNNYSVDDKKVTDHHALLITGNKAEGLSIDELKVYDRIAGRMVETFSKVCIKHLTTIKLSCADILFETKSFYTKSAAWRKVWREREEDEEGFKLPKLLEGNILTLNSTELLEKQTKPKPLHTEASLLSAMETAGKDLEDDAQRLAMKISGLGTPATRASIIETLFARDYIKREKKSLVPTAKGLTVYEVVKDKQIADVELTGMWEDAFMKIESGSVDTGNFKKSIEVYASKITEELLGATIEQEEATSLECPKCKAQTIRIYPKVAKCINEDCNLTILKKICGKNLSDAQISDLLTKGKTSTIKGLTSKAGKSFDAALTLDEEYKVKFVFPAKKKK